jgi:hypothetical protein
MMHDHTVSTITWPAPGSKPLAADAAAAAGSITLRLTDELKGRSGAVMDRVTSCTIAALALGMNLQLDMQCQVDCKAL